MWDENTTATETHPIYFSKDDSVFIKPALGAGETTVSEGMKIEVTYMPQEVALTDNTSDIKLPSWVVDAIFQYGLTPYILEEKSQKQEALQAHGVYDQKLSDAR